jgi:phosphate starvation-inducible PhoH-like protein
MTEPHSIEFANTAHAQALFGHRDEHLAILADELTVDLHTRGTRVLVSGDPVDVKLASAVLRQIYDLISSGYRVSAEDFVRASAILQRSPSANLRSVFLDTIVSGPGGRRITPKTLTQKDYVDLMRAHDIVFGIGPAGTGKTYLAMAVAVSYLINKRVKRIILTRPAVEAGEKLGFLPGDMQEKISPYLRPLYDALHDMLDFERASQLLERGIVEVAPLAFMRGRTLSSSSMKRRIRRESR